MTSVCGHYTELLRTQGRATAEAHLLECDCCRFCFGKVAEPIHSELHKLPVLPVTVEPVTPVLSGRACLIGLLAYAGAALLAVGYVTELNGLAAFVLPSAVLAMLLLAALISAAYLLCRVSVPGEILPRWSLLLLPGALLLFLAGAFVAFPLDWSRGLRGDGGCLLYGIGVALGITPLLLAAGRRRGVREWRVTAPVLGAFGGTTGLLALLQHCPIQEASHLALMHWPVTVAAIGIGVIAGRLADKATGWY